MKLKYNFELLNMGDEIIAVPISSSTEKYEGVIKLNESGAVIFEYLMKGMEKEEIIDKLTGQYSGNEKNIENYVSEFLDILNNKGFIVR